MFSVHASVPLEMVNRDEGGVLSQCTASTNNRLIKNLIKRVPVLLLPLVELSHTRKPFNNNYVGLDGSNEPFT